MERTERVMIRWMCGVTLKDRCKSEELRTRLEIEDIANVVRKRRLAWFGHLERNDAGAWVYVSMQKYGYCRKCSKKQIEKEVE